MMQKVRVNNVKKKQRVVLVKDLPLGKSFGNKNVIPKDSRGDVSSEGFIAGTLMVKFYTHLSGTENTKFNELSAGEFLITDSISN